MKKFWFFLICCNSWISFNEDPLPILINKDFFFICLKKDLLIKSFVSFVAGSIETTISDNFKKVFKEFL